MIRPTDPEKFTKAANIRALRFNWADEPFVRQDDDPIDGVHGDAQGKVRVRSRSVDVQDGAHDGAANIATEAVKVQGGNQGAHNVPPDRGGNV